MCSQREKLPGYDFKVLEDGSIIGCGKNDYFFSILKLTAEGQIVWDKTIELGVFCQAKSLELLPSGNFAISGDYVPENGRFTSFIMEVNGFTGRPIWAKRFEQFSGSFQHQELELIDGELHLSLMGNNTPSEDDPALHNYSLHLAPDGNVIAAHRSRTHYLLADYQRIIRGEASNIVYGSVYDEGASEAAGIIYTYRQQLGDPCYWSEVPITTIPLSSSVEVTEEVTETEDISLGSPIPLSLTDLKLETEGTCRPMDETIEEADYDALSEELPGKSPEAHSVADHYELTIYPNPNDGRFTIRTNYETVDATIVDLTGKVVFKGRVSNGDQIDLSAEPSGVYVMQLVTNKETITRRISIN